MKSRQYGRIVATTGAVRGLAALAVGLTVLACEGSPDPDREALARQAAPAVKNFLATGAYVEVDGEPAVTLNRRLSRIS
jgi:hypothetical protein